MSNIKNNLTCLLFLAPFTGLMVLFFFIPLFTALGISLTNWNFITPLGANNFVGLDNYRDIFTDPQFYNALVNTVRFSVMTMAGSISLSFMLALLFQRAFAGSGIYQMVFFSPWVTPTVAVSLVWSWMYRTHGGFFNVVLGHLGIAPVEWLTSSDMAMTSIAIFTVWRSLGWYTIFFIAALEKVPASLYEAAEIDGAGYLAKLRKVTIPLISPTTLFLLIVSIIDTFQVFDQIRIMTDGHRNTTTLLFLYYQRAFSNFQMGYAASIAVIILVIIAVLSICTTVISKRWVHYD